MAKKLDAQKDEQEEVSQMDEYGCIIKSIGDIVTTEQPEAEIAEETEE